MAYDLVIKDAQILDGTGTPSFSGDVAVTDGKIAAVGAVSGAATRVIDAAGRTLAPGFIDIHTHMDAQLLWDPLATSTCWHGVTTLVLGNCSFAIAPCRPTDHDYALQTLVRVEGMSLEALVAGVHVEPVLLSDRVAVPHLRDAGTAAHGREQALAMIRVVGDVLRIETPGGGDVAVEGGEQPVDGEPDVVGWSVEAPARGRRGSRRSGCD